MMRAKHPALPESKGTLSPQLAEVHDRVKAAMPPGTRLHWENKALGLKLEFAVVEHGPEPFHLDIAIIDTYYYPPQPEQTVYLPSSPSIPQHRPHPSVKCEYLAAGNCYWCCETCNTDDHRCLGCGEPLDHNGRESNGQRHEGCTD